jgi:hypothetical protein
MFRSPCCSTARTQTSTAALLAHGRSDASAGGATALGDLEYPPRDTTRALPHLLAEALQRAGEDPDSIGQQRRIGGVVNVGFDDGGIDPQASPMDDSPTQCDQPRQHVVQDGLTTAAGVPKRPRR